MYDLFQLAGANAFSLESGLTAVIARMSTPQVKRLNQFVEQVKQEGRVSINMRPWTLSNILAGARYQTIFEWAREMASFSGKSPDTIMRERLGEWYTRRVAFAKTFVDGEDFHYGALNIGGAGPVRHGEFCVVLKQDISSESRRIAYIKTDSLKGYVDSKSEVNVAAIAVDVSSHSHRQHLAAIKHADEVVAANPADWPVLLCSDRDYIEADFLDDEVPDYATEIRVTKADNERLWGILFNSFDPKASEGERALGNDFTQVLRGTREKSIALIEV